MNEFYRYEHRSCLKPIIVNGVVDRYEITGIADCGNPKELSRFNQEKCAAWMEWGQWSSCVVQETVPITEITLTTEVHG